MLQRHYMDTSMKAEEHMALITVRQALGRHKLLVQVGMQVVPVLAVFVHFFCHGASLKVECCMMD
jgi:hypothetical protein